MAESVNAALDASLVIPLGEPTGWDGPYTAVGYFVVYGPDLIGSNGMPHATEAGNHVSPTHYLDVPNIGDAQPWKKFTGEDKGSGGGTEFILTPNDGVSLDNFQGCGIGDGRVFHFFGQRSAGGDYGMVFDLDANTRVVRQGDTSRLSYNEISVSDGQYMSCCLGGDGNIYAFGGIRYATAGQLRFISKLDADTLTWTEESTELIINQVRTCLFATKLNDGRIWFGGGSSQASCSGSAVYDTWYWDPSQSAGSRLANGPALPTVVDSVTMDYRKAAVATLGDGKVYIDAGDGTTTKKQIIFDPVGETFTTAAVVRPGARHNGLINHISNLTRIPDGRLVFYSNTELYISTHA